MKTSLLSAVALAVSSVTAPAYILIGSGIGAGGDGNLLGNSPVANAGGAGAWEYHYQLELDGASIVGGTVPATQFALWDYPGVTAASIVSPAGQSWTITVGVAPAPIDPAIVNTAAPDVHAVYTGMLVSDTSGGATADLGILKVTSTMGNAITTPTPNFQSLVNVKLPQGNVQLNTLTAVVPVPEGSTIASMVGLGLLGAGYFIRRRMKA